MIIMIINMVVTRLAATTNVAGTHPPPAHLRVAHALLDCCLVCLPPRCC